MTGGRRQSQDSPPIYDFHPLNGPGSGGHPNVASRTDSSGWYIPVPTGQTPNQPRYFSHPPGLFHQSNSSPLAVTALSSEPASLNPTNIHDFWKGRLAPFPGFTSRPGLAATTTKSRAIRITTPTAQHGKPQLLSPRSYTSFGSSEGQSSPISEPSVKTPEEHLSDKDQPFQFDKYADVFVPQYLKDIQKQPHILQPLPSVPIFPSLSYLQSFLFPNLIEELCKPRIATLLSTSPPSASPGLSVKTYHEHWATLLGWELDKLALEKEKIVLWKIGIKVAVWATAEFILHVPGIRENYPRLEIGDLIQMREVLEKLQKGSGMAFEGRVVALRKREGFIHLVCPTLKNHIEKFVPAPTFSLDGLPLFTPEDVLPTLFNVSFTVNARPSFTMETAVSTLGEALKVNIGELNLARHWLFPDPEDLDSYISVYSVDRDFQDGDWIDTGLNSEQQFTASSIALHQSPVPYLISGPPGTGKTRTIAETVLQILRLQPESCILLCAPSNSATDTLVLRLRPFLQPNQMLRLNDQNRTFAEVPIKITQYCYVENNKFSLPPWKILMKYRVVVCSCLDAGILVAAQCTNTSLMRLEEEVMSCLHSHRETKPPISPHWTHLLIDEAAQGSEPELLIPISVVFAQPGTQTDIKYPTSMFIPQLVLCGDPQQLGPIVASDAARTGELDISLLERLFERPLYMDHPQARSKMRSKPPRSEIFKFKPFSDLVKNYRSHPAILMPPSAIFYEDSLEPYASNGVITWSGLPNRHLPLIFIGHQNTEVSIDERATWFNVGEIDRVVVTIKSLLSEGELSSPPLRPAHIGVMAPWREQVWKLRARLREENLSAVDVGTVEDYQGRESRVVIISCVRSSERFLKEDLAKGLGLVHEKKRMNVAITRARELLIVIGNGSVLKYDTYWKAFLQFALRNKLYVGPELDIEMDGNYISRLESDYIRTKASELEEEEQGVAIAGGIAREVLRDGGG